MNHGRKASSWTWYEPSLHGFWSKVLAPAAKPTAKVGSPVSIRLLHPYCGAFGVLHDWTVLVLNGSFAHSAISWLNPTMSFITHIPGPKKPGVSHDDQTKVSTGWLPFQLAGPPRPPVA